MIVWHLDPAAFTLPYDRHLTAALRRQGVDARLLTSRSPFHQPEETPYFFRLMPSFINQRTPLRRLARGLHYPLDLLRLMLSNRADIYHIHWPIFPRLEQWQLARPKIVMTLHDIVPNHMPRSAAQRYYRLYDRADALIIHSDHNRTQLPKYMQHKTHTIPHGAFFEDVPPAPDARQRLGLPLNVPLIVMVGSIQPYKGLDVLAQAFQQVRQAVPNAHLVVAGQVMSNYAGGKAAVERLLEIPQVIKRLYFLPNADVPMYLDAASVLVLPYHHLTGSGIAPSAATRGIPIIASRVGCLPDYTDYLVSPGDADALAQQLIAVLHQPPTRHVRPQPSWDTIALRTLEVYKAIL
jgi:glycosyltransferase involved in cell wall biosynthesis